MSCLSSSQPYELVAIGAFFGLVPDLDLLLSPLIRGAHRCAGSHSFLAAVWMSCAWAVSLLMVAPKLGIFEAVDTTTLLVTTTVVFASVFIHAIEDSFSRGGCRLFYPLSRKRIRGPVRYDDIATNSAITVVAAAVILVTLGSQG